MYNDKSYPLIEIAFGIDNPFAEENVDDEGFDIDDLVRNGMDDPSASYKQEKNRQISEGEEPEKRLVYAWIVQPCSVPLPENNCFRTILL